MKRIAIGMETSGATRDAVIALGHSAISIDVLAHQHGGPHHVGDVFEFHDKDSAFDAGIYHPTCTYHAGSASWAFNEPDFVRYPGVGYHQRLKPETLTGSARWEARRQAEEDVRRLRHLPFPKVIENPVGTLSHPRNLGPAHQIVQPYDFGSDASKKTCLWFFDANGKPMPTRLPIDRALFVPPRMWCPTCRACSPYSTAFGYGCPCGAEAGLLRPRWGNQTDGGQNKVTPGELRWQVRSDTYPGIAAALAKVMTSLSPSTTTTWTA